LAAMNFVSQLHILVDFKYLFGEYFGFEIWYTCDENEDDVAERISW